MKKIFFILLLTLSNLTIAQENPVNQATSVIQDKPLIREKPQPPISFETLFGDKRINFALSMNKPIAWKIRFIGSSSVATMYDHKKAPVEITSSNSFALQFHKNIAASVGMQYHFRKGLIPSVALHISHSTPTWLVSVNPYYNIIPWANVEVMAMVEFKPVIKKDFRIYSRLQGLYGHDLSKDERERAFLNFRLGFTYLRYTIGIGGNLDFYRTSMKNIQNYGGFFRINI